MRGYPAGAELISHILRRSAGLEPISSRTPCLDTRQPFAFGNGGTGTITFTTATVVVRWYRSV